MADTSIENREEFERQLVRKIDLRLLPILLIMYILNHMDRTNSYRWNGSRPPPGRKRIQLVLVHLFLRLHHPRSTKQSLAGQD
ncbi:hypothetical protein BC936DRAFT_138172 [Jimgerdemannia flammicorona]|uniref:Uncharacterized protein n=1 Tax=Jimgerdemannia flammicorona TaxID=994334 RepID=A0A433DIJ0_9FUNG|nr:hypothetical protein BC936DRAFT_138172 [Jimgerdemannia flammicorona]